MAIEINLTPEDVDQIVKDAILKAGIGKTIDAAIREVLNKSSYNNPIHEAVKRYVLIVVDQLLAGEYKESVENAVREALQEKITKETLTKITDAAVDQIVRSVEDRY